MTKDVNERKLKEDKGIIEKYLNKEVKDFELAKTFYEEQTYYHSIYEGPRRVFDYNLYKVNEGYILIENYIPTLAIPSRTIITFTPNNIHYTSYRKGVFDDGYAKFILDYELLDLINEVKNYLVEIGYIQLYKGGK